MENNSCRYMYVILKSVGHSINSFAFTYNLYDNGGENNVADLYTKYYKLKVKHRVAIRSLDNILITNFPIVCLYVYDIKHALPFYFS